MSFPPGIRALPAPISAGNRAGFVLSLGGSTLSADLLADTTRIVLLNLGTPIATATSGGLINLELLGTTNLADEGDAQFFAAVDASDTFDAIRIEYASGLSALSSIGVHNTCVGPTPLP